MAVVCLVCTVGKAGPCGGNERLRRAGVDRVSFEAADGLQLRGNLFGSGTTAVVASHMGRGGDSQLDWVPTARLLAREILCLDLNLIADAATAVSIF